MGVGVAAAVGLDDDSDSRVDTDVANGGTSTTSAPDRTDCGALLESLLDPETDAVLFLQPEATPAEVMDKADALRSRSDVADVLVHGKETVYDQFRQSWADSPQVVETVTPEILPWQIEVDLVSNEDPAALDFVLSEKLSSEQESLQNSGSPPLVREVVPRSEVSSTVRPCGPEPTDEPEPATTTVPIAEEPSAADEALIQDFLRFAGDPTEANLAVLPLGPEISLGLGSDLVAVRSAEDLADPSEWVIELPDGEPFRASTGTFSAVDTAARASSTSVSVGEHPHCASPPIPSPHEVAGLRRVSVQGNWEDGADAPPSCLSWFTVDFFVADNGQVTAITLDLWEP
ncbi:MAG: permease-like cell division protein FtsX [Acidimicrobiales bacterium]|nr:permease-like cell division protein FtsX [Acidimicrobiales bacterium]